MQFQSAFTTGVQKFKDHTLYMLQKNDILFTKHLLNTALGVK